MDNLKKILTSFLEDNYSETIETFRIFSISYNSNIHNVLLELFNEINNRELGEISVIDEFESIVNIESNYNAELYDTTLTFILKKNNNPFPFFLTEKAFKDYMHTDISLNMNAVALLFIEQTFRSLEFVFQPLSLDRNTSGHYLKVRNAVRSIEYVKPLNESAQRFLPGNIYQWITTDLELRASVLGWKVISTQKLLCLLSTEFYLVGNELDLIFLSEGRRNIKIKLNQEGVFVELTNLIHKICEWIFVDSRDIATKHTIFNSQITIQLQNDNNITASKLPQLINNAFENSKLVYKYHLYKSSKELSKILIDLNKTIFDYTEKIRKNTLDLVTSLWRDFTTILGVLILRYTLKNPSISNQYYQHIGLALIIYLILSLSLNAYIGFWYYGKLKSTIKNDHSSIYGYLTDSDYHRFAVQPIENSFAVFKRTFLIILLPYLAIVIYLAFDIWLHVNER